jgi:2-C-methyl-D-erythritol 4-phosphate cytidylyltransferase
MSSDGGDGLTTVAAVLVAGGSGTRLGADVPKAFVRVAGRTLLEYAVARFLGHDAVRDVVVAAPAALTGAAAELVPGATVVAGGRTRQESVARALAVLAADVEVVLVHDVARAFVPAALIDRVLDGVRLRGADGAVPFLGVTDTVRRVTPAGDLGELVDRTALLAMQTPQGFRRAVLDRAHAAATTADATDDAALVQALGGRVVAVRGDERAFKVTVPLDLMLAEALVQRFGADLESTWWDVEHG